MFDVNLLFKNLDYFEPQTYKNLTVIGIKSSLFNDLDILPLKKGLDMGIVEITEVNAEGNVNLLSVKNNAVTPLLILEGEEVIGAKQNRIFNSTYVISPKSTVNTQVSCTELGRWNYKSSTFKYSNHFAHSTLRRCNSEEVYYSLENHDSRYSNQSRVWEEIDKIHENFNIDSDTQALRDMYLNKKSDFLAYQKHFPLQDNQIGSIIIINNEVIGIEFFYNYSLYKYYHNQIIESYIPDAICNYNSFDDINYVLLSKDFINEIISSEIEEFDLMSIGEDYRIKHNEISGSVTLINNDFINASFLRKVKSF